MQNKIVYGVDKAGKKFPIPNDRELIGRLSQAGVKISPEMDIMAPASSVAPNLSANTAEPQAVVEEDPIEVVKKAVALPVEQAQQPAQEPKAPITKEDLAQGDEPKQQTKTGSMEASYQGVSMPSDKGFRELQNVYDQEANAAFRHGEMVGKAYEGLQNKLAEQEVKRIDLENKNRQSIEDAKTAYMNKTTELLNDMKNMSTPKQLMANVSTPQKIFASLALSFGNTNATDYINKSIDDEIKAQQQKIAIKAKGIDLQEKFLLDHFKEVAKDDREALLMTKKALIEYAQVGLDGLMAKSKSQDALFNAKENRAKLQLQKDQIDAQIYQARIKDNVLQSINPLTPWEQIPEEMGDKVVEGFGLFKGPKEGVMKFRESMANAVPAMDALGKLSAISNLGTVERKNWLGQNRVEADQLREFLVGRLRTDYAGPGAFTENEKKAIRDLIGDPRKVDFFKLEKHKIDTMRQLVAKNLTSTAIAYGANPDQAHLFKINRDPKDFLRQTEVK